MRGLAGGGDTVEIFIAMKITYTDSHDFITRLMSSSNGASRTAPNRSGLKQRVVGRRGRVPGIGPPWSSIPPHIYSLKLPQTDPKQLTNYFLNPRIRERRSLLTQQLL